MKKKLLLALLCPHLFYAQIETTVSFDKIKGSKIVRTQKVPFKKRGSRISLEVVKSEGITLVYLHYSEESNPEGCFSKYEGLMQLKLQDGTVMNMRQITDTDCADYALAGYVPLSPEEWKDPDWENILQENVTLLTSQPWELMRFYKTEYYIEVKPKSTRKNKAPEKFFMDAIEAINKEF